MPEFLEALMVIAFGISWPMNIVKSVRARTAKGRDDDGWRAEFIRLAETAQLMEDTRPKETPQQRPQQEKKPDPPKDVTVTIDL